MVSRKPQQTSGRESGLDGYKFDAGETCFLPPDAITHALIHPNQYTQRYVDFVSQHFSLTVVRSGWFNQQAPIFFRQWVKAISWGADNGLHSVLMGILALGMIGYPFIQPDMIGGNTYKNQPDAEMMIRWMQLNALLPAMQFSLAPWEFGEECADICRQYADLHTQFAPQIIALAKEATQTGAPIIRPIWWLGADDEQALVCDEEFLLGNDVLIAPVLQPAGSEFTAKRVRAWLKRLDVKPLFIEPASPWENGYIKSLNGKMRDELLAREIFYSPKEAQVLSEMWRRQYNSVRPHSALGYRPPCSSCDLCPDSTSRTNFMSGTKCGDRSQINLFPLG